MSTQFKECMERDWSARHKTCSESGEKLSPTPQNPQVVQEVIRMMEVTTRFTVDRYEMDFLWREDGVKCSNNYSLVGASQFPGTPAERRDAKEEISLYH